MSSAAIWLSAYDFRDARQSAVICYTPGSAATWYDRVNTMSHRWRHMTWQERADRLRQHALNAGYFRSNSVGALMRQWRRRGTWWAQSDAYWLCLVVMPRCPSLSHRKSSVRNARPDESVWFFGAISQTFSEYAIYGGHCTPSPRQYQLVFESGAYSCRQMSLPIGQLAENPIWALINWMCNRFRWQFLETVSHFFRGRYGRCGTSISKRPNAASATATIGGSCSRLNTQLTRLLFL